jgi:integrase
LEVLQGFYQSTGKRFSLHGAAVQVTEAASKLKDHSLADAVDGFLGSVVTVKRISVHEAIEQFIAFRKSKTVAAEGRRPQLSEDHWRNTGYWLREFAGAFPGHDVCDLTKQHLDAYMTKFAKAAPKTRNERRGVVKMFMAWAVEQDFLPPSHRLAEASQLKHENADVEVIECYTARELRALLEAAPPDLQPVLALAGLAGLREKEILRLTWQDVFRVPGHIEVGALKSKTRSRRLVEVCASLGQWLEPYRGRAGAIWTLDYKQFHEAFLRLRSESKIQHRRNGLRHAFVSAHYAMHGDEGRTAQQAGNSPAMVHKNYKGLMTKKDGEAWFAVAPAQAANVIPLPAVSRKDAQ